MAAKNELKQLRLVSVSFLQSLLGVGGQCSVVYLQSPQEGLSVEGQLPACL